MKKISQGQIAPNLEYETLGITSLLLQSYLNMDERPTSEEIRTVAFPN